MDIEKEFILLEINYDHIYLYSLCNKIRKSVKDMLPMFDEDEDPAECIRFWDKDKKIVLRISPGLTGIMIDMSNEYDENELENAIKVFHQMYSLLIPILDIKEDIIDYNIITNYIVRSKTTVEQITNTIQNMNIIKNIIKDNIISEQQISFEYMEEDYTKEFLCNIKNEDEINIQVKNKYKPDFDIYRLKDEIKKNDNEVNEFINIK